MTPRRTTVRTLALLLAGLANASIVAAQDARDTTSAHLARHEALFTPADAALGAAFIGLTVATFHADRSIAQRVRAERGGGSRVLDRGGAAFEFIASPGALVIGPALYAFGRLGHHAGIEDLGAHGTEAVVLAAGITEVLKGTLGRSRPYVTLDTNPRDFRLGGGFSGEERSSFPSGHATLAFAAASSAASELRRTWPGHDWLVGSVLYGGATLVGLSRVYHDEHWASDVALGAAIGTFSGLKVVRYAHAHPDNVIDRAILRASVTPTGHGGGVLAWSVPM